MRKLLFCICGSLIIGCVGASSSGSSHMPELGVVCFTELPAQLNFAGERVPIELPDVKEALQREMCVTMYMHSRTMQTLCATKRYFPYIEKILKKYGVPTDFKYLCMAESGLNPNAISSVKAAGLWQFMASAAKDYGVETGENVDLRYQIEAATEAAAKYLNNSYDRYGNWTLAAASYNAGLTGIARRSDIQGVDNYYDLFLPEETMRYVYRILSMKLVEQNPEKYGFKLREADYLKPFVNYTEIQVDDTEIDWSDLAAKYGTNYKMLRVLNPWIREYTYTNKSGKSYTVKMPNKDFRTKGF